ncbi:MAG: chloride channel protein [Ruminococcus sp.]|nr:chloride channel protein [Ruminococcus sp.]
MWDKTKSVLINMKDYTLTFLKWLLLGSFVGALCGPVGFLFSKALSFVTDLRSDNYWLVALLPLGGMLSVAIYKLCRVSDVGTNRVLESIRTEKTVPALLFPAIFIGSVITHLFGGSAGREGAALQLGGSISSMLCRLLHLNEKSRHVLTMCGMGAVFSALFGTPLGACVFALEVVSVGRVCSAAFFPCIIASITAFWISTTLGVTPESFPLQSVPEMQLGIMWKVIVVAIVCALVSILFCLALHTSEKLFRRFFKNEFLRIAVGGTIILLLTMAVGSMDYNGGGVNIIHHIFTHGEVRFEAFALKILFTAITVGAGYKGGEIVPTMFIGGTLGGSLAILLGLDPGFGAALGIAALFCGVTNCPLATMIICIELFGSEGMIFFALSAIISFLLSGKASLYTKQKFIYSKLSEDVIATDEIKTELLTDTSAEPDTEPEMSVNAKSDDTIISSDSESDNGET